MAEVSVHPVKPAAWLHLDSITAVLSSMAAAVQMANTAVPLGTPATLIIRANKRTSCAPTSRVPVH